MTPKLKVSVRMLSETVRADAREGDIGMQLGEIAKPTLGSRSGAIRSSIQQHGPNTNVVLRARDAQKLSQAKRAVEEMLERVRGARSNSARASPSHGENRGSSPLGSATSKNRL